LANTVLLALTSAFISIKQDYTQARTRVEVAEHFAYTDLLTELPNRHSLQQRLHDALARAQQQKTKVAVLFTDLDGFKVFNDTLGHEAGDYLLKQLAVRLRSAVRPEDFVARISGDEFIVITEGPEAVQAAGFLAQKIQAALVSPFSVSGQALSATVSIGISVFPDDAPDGSTLLKHADTAMYRVKRSGKNSIQHYRNETDAGLERQRELERDLVTAVQEQQVHLVYQPMYDLVTGKLKKLEALARWHHPKWGHVPPGDFIPLAEQSGCITTLGPWVLNEACRQAKAWQRAGIEGLTVSVNVSPLQFGQPSFFNTVTQVLEAHQLMPEFLELELTEGVVLHGLEHVAVTLDRLQRLGVSVAIDDFGTGYSSLAYLRELPIDTIKIDRSFVRDLGSPRKGPQFALALVEAIMSVAAHLDLEVVAEGIENQAQCELLKRLGCQVGQGHYFSKPLAASEVESCLVRVPGAPGVFRGLMN
ncbi:MAG TPA: EAL domain-containing protein, partial [Trueperaceae bacterium]